MKHKPTAMQPAASHFWRYLALLCLSILVGCGGAGVSISNGAVSVSSGVGSGGSGVAEGSVTGFGSVIVDGVEYDDSSATSQTADASGNNSPTEVKLGQRVRIEQNQDGTAKTIQVLPLLRGPVSQSLSNGYMQVLGQWVQIINSTTASGPSTVLDGYTGSAQVSKGDIVEVHGVWLSDSSGKGTVLQASRVERLDSSTAVYLLSGKIVQRSGNDVILNATGSVVLRSADPFPASLQTGAQVAAWIDASVWNTKSGASDTIVQARRIVDASPQLGIQQTLTIGLPVGLGDIQNGQLKVQGLTIDVPAALINSLPSNDRTLVQLAVTKEGESYKLQSVQGGKGGVVPGGTIELKGAILWPSNTTSLRLRDTDVLTPLASFTSGCRDLPVGSLVYVQITASRPAPGSLPTASKVQCQSSIPGGSMLGVSGVVKAVASNGQSLTLASGTQTLVLQITASSLVPPDLANWLNRQVDVQYLNVGATSVLRQLKQAR